MISIKDNIAVNSRGESGGTYRELLEFGKVLFLALRGNYVGTQTAIILYAVLSSPGHLNAKQGQGTSFFLSKLMMEPYTEQGLTTCI